MNIQPAAKMKIIKISSVLCIGALMLSGCNTGHKKLWILSDKIMISAVQDDQQKWGLAVEQQGIPFLFYESPIHIEVYRGADDMER